LTNTDASILNLKLENDFKVRSLSETEAYEFIKEVDRISLFEAGIRLFTQNPCLNSEEKRLYVIDNSIEVDIKPKVRNFMKSGYFEGTSKFDNKIVHRYLNPTFQFLRLFKEGDLRIPLKYYFINKNGKPTSFMCSKNPKYCSRELFHLENSELTDLNIFLRDTKLPFKESFLQLAFENYTLSYEIANRALSFLTLMISLETLLNPSSSELRYRISRNTAVLLGTDEDESKKIFAEIKLFYDKRSEVVHTGKSKTIKKENLLKLRYYVRESIKKMYLINKSKEEILDQLNSSGFENNIT